MFILPPSHALAEGSDLRLAALDHGTVHNACFDLRHLTVEGIAAEDGFATTCRGEASPRPKALDAMAGTDPVIRIGRRFR